MGRLRVVSFHIRSFESGSLRLYRLRTALVGPLQQALIMYGCIRAIWIPTNLVALMVAELDDNLPRFMDV
jgi:hypothetical protein